MRAEKPRYGILPDQERSKQGQGPWGAQRRMGSQGSHLSQSGVGEEVGISGGGRKETVVRYWPQDHQRPHSKPCLQGLQLKNKHSSFFQIRDLWLREVNTLTKAHRAHTPGSVVWLYRQPPLHQGSLPGKAASELV